MSIPAKRKLDDHSIEQEDASEVVFVMKHEPEDVQRSHLVKLLVGEYVQLSTRKAIQNLLPDPAYFQCAPNPNCHEYRIIIPSDVDPWATHVILLAALNEGMPLDCKSTAKGLTLHKLHSAAEFLKITTEKIGLLPLTSSEDTDAPDNASTDTLDNAAAKASNDEDTDASDTDDTDTDDSETDDTDTDDSATPSSSDGGVTKEPEGNNTTDPPSSGKIYLFTTDQNQYHFRDYDCSSGMISDTTFLAILADWSVYKEMGPSFDGGVLFRVGDGQHMKTYAYSFIQRMLTPLFEEKIDSGENYPLTVINDTVYRWDFKSRGAKSNKSFRYDTDGEKIEGALKLPKKFRKEAAFATSEEKLYYCGGFLSKDAIRSALTTVEVYDAESNKWSNMPRMQQPRRCFAAQVCNGYLYVTGGAYDEEPGIHKSCERLKVDGEKAKWETIGSLRGPRYKHCMFVLGGKMYVCGGQTTRGQAASSVECYDDSLGSWRVVDMKLGWPITSCEAVE